MRISFRQGLVHVPANFINLAASQVSLVVPPTDSVIMTFADGTSDYLFTERTSVSNAWTGPFVSGTDYWLYWDINLSTGARTFGHTLYEPVEAATAPVSPLTDQHWFDTANNIMKVWSGTQWIRKVRVFAAKLTSGSVFVSMSILSPVYTGTQIGSLSNIPVDVGYLIFDAVNGGPIKKSDGTFFTTTTLALTGAVSSSHVKMGSIIIEALAVANIPAFSIVRFTDYATVSVATNYLIDNGMYGIVEYGATTGGTVNVTLEGLIQNPDWDWSASSVNTPLYVDINGYLTTVAPPTPIIVAAVVDATTILLRPSSLFLNTLNDPATTTDPGTVVMSVAPVDAENPIAVGDNDSRITSILPHVSDTTVHLTTTQNTFLDSLVGYSGGLVAMTSLYAGITRTLVGPAEGLTITNGDGTAGNPTFALANDLAALEGLAATGIPVRTATDTWSTRSLIAPAAGLTITNNDGVAGNPTFVLANDLAGVEGLATTGFSARTADGVWSTRSLLAPASGFTITDGDGVAGNPTFVLANDLAGVEGLSGNGVAVRTAADTWTTRSIIAPAAGITITNPDGVLGDPTLVLANDLNALEALTTTGYAVRQNNSPEIWLTRSIVAQSGETTVTNGDGTAGNTIIGLPVVGTPVVASFVKVTTDAQGRISATAAVTPTDITTALAYTPVNKAGDTMTGTLVLNADPVNPLEAATKQYVDNLAAGLDPKESVRVATTGPITLSMSQVLDTTVTVVDGDRVLVKDQVDQTTNGIYVVASGGAWTRATDAVPGTNLTSGSYFFVEEGATYANSGWVLTTDNPITIASLIVFQQFSGAGQIIAGPGLSKSGNTLSVITPTAANLTINGSGVDLTATGITPGTYRSITFDTYGRATNATNPTTLAGYGIVDGQPLDADLTAISAFSGVGFAVRNTDTTWSQRSITGTANQITVSNGGGDGANPSLSLASTYVQFPGTDGTFVSSGTTAQSVTTINGGLRYDTDLARMRMVEGGAWKDVGILRTVAFTDPSEGIVHSAGIVGSTVTITTTLANDLQALEGLAGTGIATRTAANTWAQRQIAGSTNVSVANGDGVVGNPTLDLTDTGVVANTFTKVTVDAKGRVTAGFVAGTAGATTLADYGLDDDAQPLHANLTGLSAYNTNGIVVYAAGTFVGRQVDATVGTTATNLTITNPAGQAGNITLTFAGDLGPFLAAQSSTGFSARTAATTWAQRLIAGTTNRIDVTNGAGIAGNPTIDISATYVGQATITTLGTVTTGIWNGTSIGPTKGGTGLTSDGALNQLVGVSSSSTTTWEYKTIAGTANQVTVTPGVGTLTFSLPQSIDTAASVTFGNVNAPVVKSAILTLTDAANISWNMALGVHATVTLTANRTLDNPTNIQAGAYVVLIVIQDGAGGHTLAYGTAYKWAGGAAPVVAAGAAAVSVLTFISDGTNLYEVSRSLAVA